MPTRDDDRWNLKKLTMYISGFLPTSVYLVSGSKANWLPKYIGPYPIVKKCKYVAYRLQLPKNLSRVHNVFHVWQLNKFLKPPSDVVVLTQSNYNKIYHIPNILSGLSIKTTGSFKTDLSPSTWYNGVTTLKMKPHGNENNS